METNKTTALPGEELVALTAELKKTNSLGYIFVRGFVRGIAMGLGASVVVFGALYWTLGFLKGLPLVRDTLQLPTYIQQLEQYGATQQGQGEVNP